jgi:anti-sigma factor ChrR (cupin superfamily)
MLRCKEVVEQVASDAGARPLTSRLAVALHLLMCRHCRGYVRQLRQIGAAARRLYQSVTLDPPAAARVTAAVRQAAEQARPPAPPGPLDPL